MKDDLNDIDLIDLYLSGDLNDEQEKEFKHRYLEDAGFKNEVEVYRKIYEGIEQASSSDDLKKKLDGYYDEFVLDETELLDDNSNIRSINRSKALYVISGIAASVCLFAIAYWAFIGRPSAEKRNGREGYANQNHHHIKRRTISVDTGHKLDYIDHPYALTSQNQLDDTSIRQATYPQPLSYTFNNRLLSIYGDPLMGMIKLKIFKKGQQYMLVYDNHAYNFSPSKKIIPLSKRQSIGEEGIPLKETIRVEIAALPTTVYHGQPVGIVVAPGEGTPAYRYTKQKDKTMLLLQGGFTRGNCLVVNLKSSDSISWYVVRGESVYRLGKEMDKVVKLRELSGMAEPEARMFMKRGPFIQPVLSFKP